MATKPKVKLSVPPAAYVLPYNRVWAAGEEQKPSFSSIGARHFHQWMITAANPKWVSFVCIRCTDTVQLDIPKKAA